MIAAITLAFLVQAVSGEVLRPPQHPLGHPSGCSAGDIGDITTCHFKEREQFLQNFAFVDDEPFQCLMGSGCQATDLVNQPWWHHIEDPKLQHFAQALDDFDASCSRDMLKVLIDQAVHDLMAEVEKEVQNEPGLQGFSFGENLRALPFPDKETFQSHQFANYHNIILSALQQARTTCHRGDSVGNALSCIRGSIRQSPVFTSCVIKSDVCSSPDCAHNVDNVCTAVSKALDNIATQHGCNILPVPGAQSKNELIEMLKHAQSIAEHDASGRPGPIGATPYSESKAIELWDACKNYDGPKQAMGQLVLDILTTVVDLKAICRVHC